jgi:phytoene dehydrogenase-like protein
MHKHYDVIVLGRSLGALTAAALLARRDFTVLVVGQGGRPPGYQLGERTLLRRSFSLLAASSPVLRRVVAELAQSQTWKRRLVPASPMLQVLAPGMRFDLPPDTALLGRELDRELPELRRVALDLYAELAHVNAAADEAFEHDAVWPPGTFWERRETNRWAALLPFVRAEPDADLLLDFPRGHFYRAIVAATVEFATDLDAPPPPFAVARLHGSWTRGLYTLPRGEEELESLLIELIEANGGLCLLNDRAASLHLRRGVASGVVLDGNQHVTGASFVLTDLDGETVAELAGGEGIHKRARREWPRIAYPSGRFVVSIVVRREGLPEPLGPEAFLLPSAGGHARAPAVSRTRPGAPPRPVVHLCRAREGAAAGLGADEVLLVAEAIVPDRGPLWALDAREAILSAVKAELPFVERHLVAVDSVHDGLPAWLYEGGHRRRVERFTLKGGSATAEPMVRKIEVDPPGYLGLGGEPVRGPVERTLLVGRSVMPALGQEGQMLAAWAAARLVTKTDRRRERMRRDMWTKVEIG